MPVNYAIPQPTPGTSRATSPTEVEILVDVSDTIADIDARLDPAEAKLAGIENGATADQTAAEILTAVKTVDGAGSGLDADTVDGVEAAALAPLASPTFTGTPAAPTAAAGTNTTQLATTAFVAGSSFNLHPYRSGLWYFTHGLTRTTASTINERVYLSPLVVHKSAQAFDRIGMDVTTAGNAGSVIRLGIYGDTAGTPTALVTDAGTIDAATTGLKSIVISVTLQPGIYWLATVAQASATTAPACRFLSASGRIAAVGTTNQPGPFDGAGYITAAGSVPGALPGTAPGAGTASTVPLTSVRAS